MDNGNAGAQDLALNICCCIDLKPRLLSTSSQRLSLTKVITITIPVNIFVRRLEGNAIKYYLRGDVEGIDLLYFLPWSQYNYIEPSNF
jgi:hypothetical protein